MYRKRRFRTVLILTGLLMLWAGRLPAAPPAVIRPDLHVDDDNAGKQDGSALHPYKTVQQAIDAAKDGGVIVVAGGTYPQNIRVQDKAVQLYGGFAADFKTRDSAANSTHLKGNGNDTVVTLVESGASVVDGFLISDGGRSVHAMPSHLGGGFYVYGGSPTIANNVIEKNQTCPPVPQEQESRGGGIYATNSSITIFDNVIRNNVSGRGAGIAAEGKKLIIRGNTVEKNIGVSDHGGGIYLFSPDAEISHNRIIGNEIGRKMGYGWGGGIIVFNKGGNYKFSHNVFTGNFAPSVGSAVFIDDGAVASLDHDLIYANACNPAGNGAVPPVYVDGNETGEGGAGKSSTLTMNHVTIADHVCTPTVNGNAVSVTWNSKVVITNSILWNNGGDDVEADATSKATVTYTLSQETLKGKGNLSKDPLFVDAAGRDYRLRSTAGRWKPSADGKTGEWIVDKQLSPAIDAADPAAPFNLEPAPNGGRANLGFDGNTSQASKSAP